MMAPSKQQRGAALIVAILIVTLAASTAAFAIWQQSLWVRQLENITDRARADQLVAGAIDFARAALKDDKDKTIDTLEEPWASAIVLPVEESTLSGQLTDEQGRLNINNLAGANSTPPNATAKFWLDSFVRLLDDLKVPKAQELASAAADWVTNDPTGVTDLQYLALNPPYTAPRRPILDVAELARVKGFDAEIIRTIAPFVTALDATPTASAAAAPIIPVNVNTASPEVLAAIIQNLTVNDAKNVAKKVPFKDVVAFRAALPPALLNTACQNNACDVKSSYFTATVRVKSGRIEAGYTVLLDRTAGAWPGIKWRKEAAD